MSRNEHTTPPLPAPLCAATMDVDFRLSKIEDGLDEIKNALVGNPKLGHRGIVNRLETIEAEQKAQLALIAGHDRKLYLWSGIAAALGVIITTFKDKILPR